MEKVFIIKMTESRATLKNNPLFISALIKKDLVSMTDVSEMIIFNLCVLTGQYGSVGEINMSEQ